MIEKVKRHISDLKFRNTDYRKYRKDIKKYISMCEANEKFIYYPENRYPILSEYRTNAAVLDMHYFLQDIWMAERIIDSKPEIHYDIGSRVDGFIGHLLSSHIKVNMIDIRPIGINVDGLLFTQGDATDLSNIPEASIDSLSSLHVVEHIGLGRYGDKIDPKGWEKCLKAMQRVVARGGVLYLSFPTGYKNTLCFNAHRVIEFHEVSRILDQMKLIEVAYISNYQIHTVELDQYTDCIVDDNYACALYVFRKK